MDRKRARHRICAVAAAMIVLAAKPPVARVSESAAAAWSQSPLRVDGAQALDAFRDEVTIALLKRDQFDAAHLLGPEHRFARAQEVRVPGIQCRTGASLVETVTSVMAVAGFSRDYDAYGSQNDRQECATYVRKDRASDLCQGGRCTAPINPQAEIVEIVRLCAHVAHHFDLCDVTMIPFAGTWQSAPAGLQPFTEGRDRLIERTIAAVSPLEARLGGNQR
jgi:hypothetical protein